jgi:hypothetical protein
MSGPGAGGPGPGAGGTGGGCPPPLVSCPDGCVDLDTDFNNCGACGNYCPTELCIDGKCSGLAAGHLVVIGMNFDKSIGASARILGNAIFLPPDDPLRILEYRQYADPAVAAKVAQIIDAEAKARGRTYATLAANFGQTVVSQLQTGQYDVFLIHDQPLAPASQPGAFGAYVASEVAKFAQSGHTVVVLATSLGSAQMHELVTNAGILSASGFSAFSATVKNQWPGDVIGNSVPTPFAAQPTTVTIVTSEAETAQLFYVFTDDTVAKLPIVIHKTAVPP